MNLGISRTILLVDVFAGATGKGLRDVIDNYVVEGIKWRGALYMYIVTKRATDPERLWLIVGGRALKISAFALFVLWG